MEFFVISHQYRRNTVFQSQCLEFFTSEPTWYPGIQDLTVNVKVKGLSENVLWLCLVTTEIICLFGREVITSNNWHICVVMMQEVENQRNKFLSNLWPSLFRGSVRRKNSSKLHEWIDKATILQDNQNVRNMFSCHILNFSKKNMVWNESEWARAPLVS